MRTVSIAFVQCLIDEVNQQGISTQQLFSGVLPAGSDINASGFRIDSDLVTRLWLNAVDLTQDNALGLHVGKRVQLGNVQALAPLFTNSPKLGEAMEYMQQYQRILSDAAKISIVKMSGQVQLRYQPFNEGEVKMHPQQVECNLSAMQRFAHIVTQQQVAAPLSVHFEHQQMAIEQDYQAEFNCPVKFNQPFNALVLDSAHLDIPVRFADPSLLVHHQAMAKNLLASLTDNDTFIKQVYQLIQLNGPKKCRPEYLASLLNVSYRSLQRRLKQEHSSYQQVLDDYRKNEAKNLLSQQRLSIDDISDRLGYGDKSSFHRSFKRWFNTSPIRFRKETLS